MDTRPALPESPPIALCMRAGGLSVCLPTAEVGYHDLGADYIARRDPERQTKRLVAQLERLGHSVTLQEAAA